MCWLLKAFLINMFCQHELLEAEKILQCQESRAQEGLSCKKSHLRSSCKSCAAKRIQVRKKYYLSVNAIFYIMFVGTGDRKVPKY